MPNTTLSSLPLAGVRVLDLSRVFAGPLCTMALGDLGAEIIKVEHPVRGDDTRDWGKRVGPTGTTYFNCANRNKRSVTLDLQTKEGQEIARKLAAQCDVVVQNFKFGGVERLNLGYEQLRKIRPDIIYCSISGYDRSGPEAARPGYDLVMQGETGLMYMNGEPTQPPLKFGTSVVDMFTGMYATQAILAALYQRRGTGTGQHIEMALFDSGVMVSAFYGLESLLIGEDVPRCGNSHPSIVPYGVFEAQDGPLVLAVGNNAQFARFCTDVIGRPELATDERFRTNLGRSKHREALLPVINQELAARKRKDLLQGLSAANIPCGEVLGLHEALTSERAQQSGLIQHYGLPDGSQAHIMAPPYKLNGERPPVRRGPPQLGEATDEVLHAMLDLSEQDLAKLRDQGVI
ncbi:CoA transferase [Alcaligenaceae bacterium]|nr:CoA transferase [Alcaligenaceae bacterium]